MEKIKAYFRHPRGVGGTFTYQKLDHWIIQFKSFHRLSRIHKPVYLSTTSKPTVYADKLDKEIKVSFLFGGLIYYHSWHKQNMNNEPFQTRHIS